jgi:hypothetical protein
VSRSGFDQPASEDPAAADAQRRGHLDYGLETGRPVAERLADERHLGSGWPAILRRHYGEAFSIAPRLAGLLTLLRLLPVAGWWGCGPGR